MSQFYVPKPDAPLPPAVPTSFVTDDGTAIPDTNILNVSGESTSDNNDNGILTQAVPDLDNNLLITLTNRQSGSVTTTDATETTIITFSAANAGAYVFTCDVATYDTVNMVAAAFNLFFGIVSDGASCSLLNLPDKIIHQQGGLESTETDVSTSGTDVLVRVTGVSAKTLNWKANLHYVLAEA